MNALFLSASFLIVLLLAGCGTLQQHHFPGDADPPRPYLMFLPGGPGAIPRDLNRFKALRAGGFRGDIEVFEWTDSSHQWTASLYPYERNRALATRAARRVAEIHRIDPTRPIHLWGVSSGAMMSVWLLEDLPDDVRIDTAILTAPMISITYDLTRALQHVRGKCYSFTNSADFAISGLTTILFGTMDRKHRISAGEFGFTAPPTADPTHYAKLIPMPHRWEWIRYENYGFHMGCSAPLFVENVIAPLLTGRTKQGRRRSLRRRDAEITARLAAVVAPRANPTERGYRKLFLQSVTQADQGCDFDFLRAAEMKERAPK